MDVSFDLERFRWVEEGRLEVVGRWTGLRGRRGRPVLSVGGRRVSGQVLSDDPWRAVFAYEGDADGAELELGRIVVDLPRPRRLRRRGASEGPAADTGELAAALAKLDALREDLAAAQAEAAAARDDADAARAELPRAPTRRGAGRARGRPDRAGRGPGGRGAGRPAARPRQPARVARAARGRARTAARC